MAVLLTPPNLQFFDDNGAPLAGGKVYTYGAGTTTPKPGYTDSTGLVAQTNPVILDAAGRPPGGSIWLVGSYKFVVADISDVVISTTDNVTAFNTVEGDADAYFESFSGDGAQTVFTTSEDLGTDEKAIFVFVNDEAGDVGFDIQAPTAYTINGTSLTFVTAPPTGTNSIYVWAPSTLVTAAAASAAAADASATAASGSAALAAQSVIDAAAEVVLAQAEVVNCQTEVANCQAEVVLADAAAAAAALSAASLADFRQFTATGSGNAFLGNLTPDAVLTDGAVFRFKANHNISGAATMNIDGLGAKTLKKFATDDVVTGDIVDGGFYWIQYDLDNDTFQLLTSFSQASTVPFASTTVAGKAEVATAAEINTGTDAGRMMSPKTFNDSNAGLWFFELVVPFPVVADGAAYITMPSYMAGKDIVSVTGQFTGTVATGATSSFQLHNETQAADVLSTPLTHTTGTRYADTAVIDAAEDGIASGDVFRLDVDVVGSTSAGTNYLMQIYARTP